MSDRATARKAAQRTCWQTDSLQDIYAYGYEAGMIAERDRCAHSAYLMRYDLNTGETWDEALRRHKDRILNPKESP